MSEGIPRRSQTTSIENLVFSHSKRKSSAVDVVSLAELRERRMARAISAPNRIQFHMIQFVTSGHGRHWVDFEALEFQEGEFHHVQPGQVQSFDATSTHDALLLFFRTDALEEGSHLIRTINRRLDRIVRPSKDDFSFLVAMLEAQLSLDAGNGSLQSGGLGPHLLRIILGGVEALLNQADANEPPSTVRAREIVAEFEALIDRCFTTSRNLTWYASQLHLSDRTIARACKQIGRPTPKRMIDERSALEAKRMLSTSRDSVEGIGLTLGFTEATNFVKFFRRMTGTTPEAFRRALPSS